jgi:hypothetical protein
MILSLFRRDAALRTLPMWGVLFLLNASVLLGLAVTVAANRRSFVSATSLVVIGWINIAPFLAVGHGRSRCGALDLALPITGRRLWTAHLALIALAGLAMTGAYVAFVATAARILGGSVPFRAEPASMMILLGAGTLLAVVLLQAPRPSLARIPLNAGTVLWSTFMLLALLTLLPLLAPYGGAGALVPLALAVGVGVWTFRRVPPTLALVPREPAAGGPAGRAADAGPAGIRDRAADLRAARRTVLLSSLRCVTAGAKELAALPFVAFFGFLLANGPAAWLDPAALRDFRFLFIPLAIYMLFTLVGPRLGSLHHLDPLPVSRRLLFAGLILPSVAVFLIAYAAGLLAVSRLGPRTEMVDYRKYDEGWTLSAPLRVYRVAWDGRAPEIGSPWGESHPADAASLIRGVRPILYNLYSAPPGSSARFVALQASRAVEEVYGVSIPPEEIERRHLETHPDGTVAGRADSLALRAGPISAVLFFLVGVPWMLLVALLLRAYRAGVREWVRQSIVWGALGILLAIWLVETLGLMTGLTEPWLIRALVEIPTFRLGASAAGTIAAPLLAALGFLGAYRLAGGQFARMEIPARPSKYTLVEWLSEKQ